MYGRWSENRCFSRVKRSLSSFGSKASRSSNGFHWTTTPSPAGTACALAESVTRCSWCLPGRAPTNLGGNGAARPGSTLIFARLAAVVIPTDPAS